LHDSGKNQVAHYALSTRNNDIRNDGSISPRGRRSPTGSMSPRTSKKVPKVETDIYSKFAQEAKKMI